MELISYQEIIIAIICITMVICYASARADRRPKGFPPGPTRLPIIGNMHQITLRPFIKFMEMGKKYGPIFAIDFGSFPGVVINDAQLIREALGMREFSGRPRLKPFMPPRNHGILRGVIMNEGPSWAEHRRFTQRSLKDFGMGKKSMEAIIQDEIDELMSVLGRLDGAPAEISYTFNLAALNSLWWIVLGQRFDYDDARVREVIKLFTDNLADSPAVSATFFLPWVATIAPKLSGLQKLLDVQAAVLDLCQDLYDNEKATFKAGHVRHFLDLYIQQVEDTKDPDSSFYEDEGEKNVVATIADLFVAGVETVSTTIVWSVLLLSLHPEAQEKLFEELKAVTGLTRVATLSDEPNLPFTKAVISEVLRFSSILPLNIFHSSIADVADFHGYRVPKGTMIMANLYAAHHDPAVWGDPHNFRPERFVTADGTFDRALEKGVLAFSVGKRVCIGEQLARHTLFLMHANIFQKFRVIPSPAKPWPVIDNYKTGIILHVQSSYEYVFQER